MADTNRTTTISLERYIANICTSAEAEGGDGAHEARYYYYHQWAANAAHTLLEGLHMKCLTNLHLPNGADGAALEDVLRAEQIVFENFIVVVDQEGIDGGNFIHDVELLPQFDQRRVLPEILDSDESLTKIGTILYKIFLRGRDLSRPGQTARSANSIECARSCDAYKANDLQSTGESTTDGFDPHLHSSKRTIVDVAEQAGLSFDAGTPDPVRRLISDLLKSGDEVKDPFKSFADVLVEVKQIADSPEKFLRSYQPTPPARLKYPAGTLGRNVELGNLLEVVVRIPQGDESRNELVLVRGPSGSGKSALVRGLETPMAGWAYNVISLKFDRLAHRQPLTTITSAFDYFFSSIVERRMGLAEDENIEHMVAMLENELGSSSIVVLSHVLPSLGRLFPRIMRRVVSDTDLESLNNRQEQYLPRNVVPSDDQESESDANNTNRLHHLLRRVIHAISSRECPLIIFMDDVQWADQQSLDLLSSMLLDFDHIDHMNGDNPQCFMVIGSYRDDEVTESHILHPYLVRFAEAPTLEVTQITVGPLNERSANLLVSSALDLPVRVTRPLSAVICRKSMGNPLGIITFLDNLVQSSVIGYSLVERRWTWDITTVQGIPMDDNVAHFITQGLRQLPLTVQETIKTISCFGFSVDADFLRQLSSSPGFAGLASGLDQARALRIIDLSEGRYTFSHDKVQEGSYNLMNEEEQRDRHNRIGTESVFTTGVFEKSVLNSFDLIAIGQINKGRSLECSADMRCKFGALNLKAAKGSVDRYDFSSALTYSQEGLRFLEPDKERWSTNYDLCLGLNETAGISCFSLALREKMQSFLLEVDRASSKLLTVLDGLGEGLPEEKEMVYPIYDFIADLYNAFGFTGLALSIRANSQSADNFEIARRLGALSSVICKGLKTEEMPQERFYRETHIVYLFQPLQAVAATIQELEKSCLMQGYVEFAALSAFAFHRIRFFTGTTMPILCDQMEATLSMTARFEQLNGCLALVTQYATLCKLTGLDRNPYVIFGSAMPIRSEDELLEFALRKDARAVTRAVNLSRFFSSFWLGRHEEAAEYGRSTRGSQQSTAVDIYHAFYYAITALILARRDAGESKKWIAIADPLVQLFRTLASYSAWNWENKLLLMEAESHFFKGEKDAAEKKYLSSIESAKDHKFVNEQGLGHELLSGFYSSYGDEDKSHTHKQHANDCYQEWGATAVLRRLRGDE
ncbi:hypothetical protein THAOC_35945 [Thalassiosira oceanica]|uniref:Orc1-like AAA ATPase domain-containing protein n=1 Tax=Thalassiosira oceanica TaxID=159749 RepID=K0R102_THAOC|nr:hypothetical protein THAOC_35945 [Thalassiosira oceanica]|eukprot:EJK45435.1 hypothetical protein THAOC_35945 [Thalassiosira oceanica]